MLKYRLFFLAAMLALFAAKAGAGTGMHDGGSGW
jgi:hypothetical protein